MPYVALSGVIHATLGRSRLELTATLIATPLSAVSPVWSGWVLSAKRIARQDLVPFGIIGSALLALYSVGAAVYHQLVGLGASASRLSSS